MVTFMQALIVASQSNIMADTQVTRVNEQDTVILSVEVSSTVG